ncbi:MAG TPA: hypothetical protein VGS11_12890 [Candidatus Bathyarchaeia archaeon]|nr:hypothetical protein [Candidatus Bathyarchaeia archaeon]
MASKEYSLFATVLQNVNEADQTTRWMSELDVVSDVKMRIMKDFIYVDDWLDKEIEKRLLVSE